MKRQLVIALISWTALISFMGSTRPDELPVLALIVPFLLLFIVLVATWNLLEHLYAKYLVKGQHKPKLKRFGIVLSASFVVLMVLQSLGQLTVRDVMTLGAILVIGYIYVARNRHSIERH